MRAAGKLPRQESGEAINQLTEHMIFAARAHTDRLVLEAFVAGIQQTSDPDARAMLEKLCDLYALSTLEEGRAWFLEHNRMDPARSKAVTSAVNQLCAELRPHALTLVDGMGVPEEWLRSRMLVGE